jgi:hypothetical protein
MSPAVSFLAAVGCLALFLSPFAADRLHAAQKGPAWLGRFADFGLAVQIGAIALAVLVLRPGHGTTRKAIEATLQTGTPVLVELYSNS